MLDEFLEELVFGEELMVESLSCCYSSCGVFLEQSLHEVQP